MREYKYSLVVKNRALGPTGLNSKSAQPLRSYVSFGVLCNLIVCLRFPHPQNGHDNSACLIVVVRTEFFNVTC